MDEDRINEVLQQLREGADKETIAGSLRAYGHSEEEVDTILSEATRRVDGEGVSQQEVAVEESLVSFTELVSASFSDARARLKLAATLLVVFLGITLLGVVGMFALVTIAAMAAPASAGAAVIFGILGIAYFVLLMVAYIAAGVALIRVAVQHSESAGYWKSVQWGFRHIWPVVLIGLLLQLTTTTGYALLFIPGIALAIYTAFSYFVFVSEDFRGLNALLRSIDLVYGSWWAVFGRMLGLGLLLALSVAVPVIALSLVADASPVLGGVLLGVFLAVAYPFVLVWMVFGMMRLFESLQQHKPKAQFDPASYGTLRKVLIAAAILGVPILIAWNGFSLYTEMQQEDLSEDELQELPFDLDIQ